jgi:hypothetical protein
MYVALHSLLNTDCCGGSPDQSVPNPKGLHIWPSAAHAPGQLTLALARETALMTLLFRDDWFSWPAVRRLIRVLYSPHARHALRARRAAARGLAAVKSPLKIQSHERTIITPT